MFENYLEELGMVVTTVRVSAFCAEKNQKLTSGLCGHTLLNIGAEGIRH